MRAGYVLVACLAPPLSSLVGVRVWVIFEENFAAPWRLALAPLKPNKNKIGKIARPRPDDPKQRQHQVKNAMHCTRSFQLVHYQLDDFSLITPPSAPTPCALVWAAEQHLPSGCCLLEEGDEHAGAEGGVCVQRHRYNGFQCATTSCHKPPQGAAHRDLRLMLPDEDERCNITP